MYGYNNMPPPWMWGAGPTTPTPTPTQNPVDMIEGWIKGLEAVKRLAKEEKTNDPKAKKETQPSILAVALFMLLVSPVSGPVMYYFFRLSIGMLHQ